MKTTKLFAAAALLLAAGTALAGTMVIKMKDGTTASYDTAQIESVRFSDPGTASREGRSIFEERFGGELSDAWEKIGVVGGDFARFARNAASSLDVSVPAGNSWGKTGIMSRERLFSITKDMENNPLKIKLTFDPAKTTGFCVTLSEAKHPDIWVAQNAWFHVGRRSKVETFAYFANTQNKADGSAEAHGPSDMAETVTITIKPGFVRYETDSGMVGEGPVSWAKAGASGYLYVFSHPAAQSEAAAFSLKSIKMYR
ncbi:MAG: hypothetical protein WC943_07905 [Elusimicrobiota bacterium]|jgi:hypothetical protein